MPNIDLIPPAIAPPTAPIAPPTRVPAPGITVPIVAPKPAPAPIEDVIAPLVSKSFFTLVTSIYCGSKSFSISAPAVWFAPCSTGC